MPRGKATSVIAKHLWSHHGRTRSEGTFTERVLLHEELHALADPGELTHSHGPNGEFITQCPGCGHEHTCTALSDTGE
jgi:hypothetical protein